MPRLPVGDPAETGDMQNRPGKTAYHGQFVSLSPIDAESDMHELYACSHGTEETEALWTYMGYGPFRDHATMAEWLRKNAQSTDPIFFTVHRKNPDRRVGIVSFLNIVPDMRRLEVGHIWYAPEAQRTKVNTEAIYLMLCEAFDRRAYRRAEWKCDALNEKSRAAALRLGFQFEGIFRQHMIVKGRNRDTAWFSMLDCEWPAIKKNMETWLYRNENQQLSLRRLNAELQ